MVDELRTNGLDVKYSDAGARTSEYYFETGSVINIYNNNGIEASYKTKKSAMRFLLNK